MAQAATDRRRIWLGVALALVIAGLVGPWAFDRINVPAQYECSPPNIRLEGDFCGMPVRGVWVISVTADALRGLPAAWARGEPGLSGGVREILLAAVPLLLALPVVTSLVRLLRHDSRRWAMLNVAAWLLSLLLAGPILAAGVFERWMPFSVWGVWLYASVAVGMTAFEIRFLRHAGRPRDLPE